MHHTFRSSFVILLLTTAAAACSRTDTPAVSQTASTSVSTSPSASPGTSTPASAGPDLPLNLCTVMPVDVVSHALQSQIGKSVSIATPHVGGMCDYKDVDKGVPGVEVLIDFTRFRSAADATTSYQNVKKQAAGMGLALADVPGVGDEAYGSTDSEESYGVKTHHELYMGQVNVHAQGMASGAIRPAAVELAKLTVSRLPGAAQ